MEQEMNSTLDSDEAITTSSSTETSLSTLSTVSDVVDVSQQISSITTTTESNLNLPNTDASFDVNDTIVMEERHFDITFDKIAAPFDTRFDMNSTTTIKDSQMTPTANVNSTVNIQEPLNIFLDKDVPASDIDNAITIEKTDLALNNETTTADVNSTIDEFHEYSIQEVAEVNMNRTVTVQKCEPGTTSIKEPTQFNLSEKPMKVEPQWEDVIVINDSLNDTVDLTTSVECDFSTAVLCDTTTSIPNIESNTTVNLTANLLEPTFNESFEEVAHESLIELIDSYTDSEQTRIDEELVLSYILTVGLPCGQKVNLEDSNRVVLESTYGEENLNKTVNLDEKNDEILKEVNNSDAHSLKSNEDSDKKNVNMAKEVYEIVSEETFAETEAEASILEEGSFISERVNITTQVDVVNETVPEDIENDLKKDTESTIPKNKTVSNSLKETLSDLDPRLPGFKSAIEVIGRRLSLIGSGDTYSPIRLALADAFENMRINSTGEDTFLSCNSDSEARILNESDYENFTMSIDNVETETEVFVEDVVGVETNDSKLSDAQSVEAEVDLASSKPLKELNVENNIVITTDDGSTSNASDIETDNQVIGGCIPRPRKSMGVVIQPMKFELSPSPVKQSRMMALDRQFFQEGITASPVTFEKQMPQYQRYLDLKIEHNCMQQNIARSIIKLKQKEAQLLQLFPQKVTILKEDSGNQELPELGAAELTNKSVKEEQDKSHESDPVIAEAEEQGKSHESDPVIAEADLTKLNAEEKIKLLEEDIERLQKELECERAEKFELLEKIVVKKEEITRLLEENARLQLWLGMFDQLLEGAQVVRRREKDKCNALTLSLEQTIEKYEQSRAILLTLRSQEIAYQEMIEKLQNDYKALYEDYQAFKKHALEQITEANKENERIKCSITDKDEKKKRAMNKIF